MNNEMTLRYLYFLTNMNSGTDRWKECYEAWERFGRQIDLEEYSELMKKVRALHKKYGIDKKKT